MDPISSEEENVNRGEGKSVGLSKKNEGFKDGAIVRLKCTNILTCESLEFRPGPCLNLIIGPDGTGKSAIMIAIYLVAFGGKTRWRGLARHRPGTFIRSGTNRGVIEVELFHCDGDNYIIQYEICKGKDNKVTTSWLINGCVASLSSVEALMEQTNSQSGSLVQFLLQENVAEFSRMTQQELLINTQKLVGTTEMCQIYKELIDIGRRTDHTHMQLERMPKVLDMEMQKNALIEPEVLLFKEGEKILKEVKMLKMEYTTMKEAHDSLKDMYDAELEMTLVSSLPHKAELKQVDEHQLLKEINMINLARCDISAEVNNLHREIQEVQQELRIFHDVGNMRLEFLRHYHKHTYQAVMWLKQNKHRFRATIHDPIILSLNVIDPSYAKFVETHITVSDSRAFICENPDDLALFKRIMRAEEKLKVNAIIVPAQSLSTFQPETPISSLRKYGFFSYMKDLLQCPEPVMALLCELYDVHRIPVGTAATERKVAEIIQSHPELHMFYTSTLQYSTKKNRRGGVSKSSTVLSDPQFLIASVDTQRELILLQKIQTAQKTLEAKEGQYGNLQQQQAAMKRLYRSLTAHKVVHQYKSRQKEIEWMRMSLECFKREEQELKGRATQLRNQWLTHLKELISCINTNFARLFAALDYCGEVDLIIPDNQAAYEKYGLHIKVQFRDGEPLHELTPFNQNAGEQRLATALYILALQELAKCPFLCVDEISQGMDPENECKVHELIEKTVCEEKRTSQYFLFISKMEPRLHFDDKATVLVVHNE